MLITVILIGAAVITACAVNLKPSKAADNVAFVSVGEIYGNCNNVQVLYDLIGGAKDTSFAKITELATATTSAAGIRAMTYNKTADQDVQVTFGGQVWDVVYLSMSKDNRPILTLWLNKPFTNSQWNTYTANGNSAYPSDMYGTSYIRALLNNGGNYATSGTELNGTFTPNSNYVLKEFLPNGKYSNVIVTPSAVSWQEMNADFTANRPNIYYGADALYSYDDYNCAKYKVNGDKWKSDNLWLPAMTYETGQYTHNADCLWKMSINQLAIDDLFWGRDGDSYFEPDTGDRRASYIQKNKPYKNLTSDNMIFYDDLAIAELGVRPALHLDLTALNEIVEHIYGEWTVTTAPTCTTDGVRERVCQGCGHTETEVVPALGHDYQATEHPETCTDAGYTYYVCTHCGKDYQEEGAAALGHVYLPENDKVTAPKCDAVGYTTHTCSRCGHSYQSDYVPVTGHSYSQWVTTEPATTDHAGVQKRTCEVCGAEQERTLPALAGSTTNGGKDNSGPLLWGIIIGVIAVLAGCGGLAWLLIALFKPKHQKQEKVAAA